MIEKEYVSKKSKSRYIVRGTKERAFLVVTGEATTMTKVMEEVRRVRVGGSDFATVEWTARQLSNTY